MLPRKSYLSALIIAFVMISISLNVPSTPKALGRNSLQSTSTPKSVRNTYFPDDLGCSDISSVAPGPSWKKITIGISSLDEVQPYLTSLGYVVEARGDMLLFVPEDGTVAEYPPSIHACISNRGIVAALKINMDVSYSPVYLSDFIAQYNIPDAVTWTTNSHTRVLFWFKYGIALEVLSVIGDASFGQITNIIYFPYQRLEGFPTRWPYSHTRNNPTEFPDAPYPTEENPFDFDPFWATVTAQPPTAVYTPTVYSTQMSTPTFSAKTPHR